MLRQSYLVLYSEKPGEHRVRIVEQLSDAIGTWRPSTRLSPIYLLTEDAGEDLQDLPGVHIFVLLGLVEPWRVQEDFGDLGTCWLTLGSYNVIIRLDAADYLKEIERRLAGTSIAAEFWHVDSGKIKKTRYVSPVQYVSQLAGLTDLSKVRVDSELEEVFREYCPLMASALARATVALPSVVPEMKAINEFVAHRLRQGADSAEPSEINRLYMLTTLNAGLSRFTSQAFSGTQPVYETECHFWTHSLLGTAVANIALWRLSRFVFGVFGRAQIPARILQLSRINPPAEDWLGTISGREEFWQEDYLHKVGEGDLPPPSPLLPTVTFFSGRDGFKSTLYTLSAPLVVIGACNSLRWTLLTVTHEITHNIVRAVLGKIYPRLDVDGIASAIQIIQSKPANMLEALKQLLLVAAFAMHQVELREDELEYSVEVVSEVLDRWHHEIEEILVHVFDFLYFYGGDIKKYVRGIWLSWGVIPNIANRVPEYVLRTLCAVMATNLRRGEESFDVTRDQVRAELGDLSNGDSSQYVEMALRYLDDNWGIIEERLAARRSLVQIVRTFLYSDTIAKQLRSDTALGGGASRRDGYAARVLDFSQNTIDNPLTFLEAYTTSAAPSPATSLWILYMLTFNVGNSDA